MHNIITILTYTVLLISFGISSPLVTTNATDTAVSTYASAQTTSNITIAYPTGTSNITGVGTNQRESFIIDASKGGRHAGFASSCRFCYTSRNGPEDYLICDCFDGRSLWMHPSLNLAKCFENYLGQLLWKPEGNFAVTCPYAELKPYTPILRTGCLQPGVRDILVYNEVNLNDFIGNFGGRELAC